MYKKLKNQTLFRNKIIHCRTDWSKWIISAVPSHAVRLSAFSSISNSRQTESVSQSIYLSVHFSTKSVHLQPSMCVNRLPDRHSCVVQNGRLPHARLQRFEQPNIHLQLRHRTGALAGFGRRKLQKSDRRKKKCAQRRTEKIQLHLDSYSIFN